MAESLILAFVAWLVLGISLGWVFGQFAKIGK
jgi:hypothetical protein